MSSPNILIVVGHPLADSFNHALANTYADAARAGGAEVRVIDLATDPIPEHPTAMGHLRLARNDKDLPIAPEVARYVEDLDWADHVVFFYPQWWGTYPAALKSWLDRVLLAGTAHRYNTKGRGWQKLLAGRTARIITTMDSPGWWSRLVYRDASVRTLKTPTLWYCGVKTIGATRIPEIRHQKRSRLERWHGKVSAFGASDAARTPRADKTRLDAAIELSAR